MKHKLIILLLLIPLFAQSQSDYIDVSGRVVGVHDADTYTINILGINTTVRMAGVDAPELKQSYGLNARDSVAKLILNKIVTVRSPVKKANDLYGRTLGVLILNGMAVDSMLVRNGWAWYYKKYPAKYGKADQILENNAKYERRGLWWCKTAIPPELFRLFNAKTKLLYGQCE